MIKNIQNRLSRLPVISPKRNPMIPKTMTAGIAAPMACEIEKEWFIRSHTKKTRPPNIPMNKPANIAYPQLKRIYLLSFLN